MNLTCQFELIFFTLLCVGSHTPLENGSGFLLKSYVVNSVKYAGRLLAMTLKLRSKWASSLSVMP